LKALSRIPELLAPGGGLKQIQTALVYGADAVYVGDTLSLRAKAAGLTREELDQALCLAHGQGARLYYCLNILARESQLREIAERIETVAAAGVDAVIVADPGVVRMVRNIAPQLPIHLSTQANTTNSGSLAFWEEQGVSRVNLARELDLREIRSISRTAGEMETELFVHGAMCMAISGRCLLSAHLTGRSANQGLCAHPCRYEYRPMRMQLEERTREGEILWEAMEDDGYSALLAPEDLCLLPYLVWFCRVGVSALKIEGRTKSPGYLAPVLDAYRTALDDLKAGRFRWREYLREVSLSATRELATGFFLPGRRRTLIRTFPEDRPPLLGRIAGEEEAGKWIVQVLGRWEVGRPVHILLPGLHRPTLGPHGVECQDGQRKTVAHSGTVVVLVSDDARLRVGLFLRGASSFQTPSSGEAV
jgi:U32 family peptidase